MSLSAQAPQNFDATFTEQYGSQELNALPLDPGQSKDVKLKVRPPNTVAAGKYKVTAKVTAEDATATAELAVDITGQPKIDIAGREGVLSAKASAGQETSIPVILTNSGTAPAEADRAVGHRAERLESQFRAQDRRSHRSRTRTRKCRRWSRPPPRRGRRLRHHRPRCGTRRVGLADLPRGGHDLDAVGHRRYRPDRRCAAGHGRRRGHGSVGDERQRHRGAKISPSATAGPPSSRASRFRSRAERFSDCSVRTAPARRRPS